MRTLSEINKEMERLVDNREYTETKTRLEMLAHVKAHYDEPAICELLGTYLITQEKQVVLSAIWRNLNTRIWTLKWVLKTEEE